jgi:hypothetical protein
MGEMAQGGVGYDGVEAAQSFARLEEVPPCVQATWAPGKRRFTRARSGWRCLQR